MKTLAIETSCDDTSLAIISHTQWWTFKVEKLIAYSQIADHTKFGWVLPEIASRLHSEKIIALLQEIGWDEIAKVNFISTTTHPWLPGSLVVGKSVATMLAEYFHKPLVPVNHIHWHIFSVLLDRKLTDIAFPMVILTASGGHNDIYLVETEQLGNPDQKSFAPCQVGSPKGWEVIKKAYTLDDASWEAFDKVSKMLGWPYPGWPRISLQAKKGWPNERYHFKRIFLPKDADWNYTFSFSWMKSQVSFLLWKLKNENKNLTENDISDIAYEFQEATIETLANRLLKCRKEYDAKTIAIAGGVSANDRLVEYIENSLKSSEKILWKFSSPKFLSPAKKVYSTDNWAMIWVAWILHQLNIL